MISNPKLQSLIQQTEDVPQLSDIREALRELQWRRLNEPKLQKKVAKLKAHLNEVRPHKLGPIRRLMERLNF